ncbi:Holliday junction branch migration protein RuvA [Amphritea balenae]|uniref:Holliday junction branch migration complex subunit RuvA n=1 Tax=Amphritea balenae TaxID=452629 RepID=A0A3P1SHV8_9GAMM|nr:Holliday junction branch migration protein RuvA [Amphritea balenae]RRC96861.1 Holliday junction branch migration protein RuvA [Amphritea balenae]GGK61081.1 Holliday junction ATP-dependent DNA helicase RuvA [Amphritea balenae]
MIGRLKGELLEKHPPQLVLDVNGVGYEVDASMNTFYRLPKTGATVTLHTHMVVREDAQLLYGFYERSERSLFRTLIKVNGVGPKLALTILSGISVNEFVQSVNHQDTAALVRLPGVGKKTAERLIIEMKDKLKDFQISDADEFTLTDDLGSAPLVSGADNRAEAESALVALGYKPVQATKAISQAEKALGMGAASEELIRAALKSMVQG